MGQLGYGFGRLAPVASRDNECACGGFRYDPDLSILDIYWLRRYDATGPRPPAARVQVLGDEQSWADAKDFAIGYIFDQDQKNMALVREGMKASRWTTAAVSLGNYLPSDDSCSFSPLAATGFSHGLPMTQWREDPLTARTLLRPLDTAQGLLTRSQVYRSQAWGSTGAC